MPRPLLARVAPECIQEFERAADERHADALALAGAERRTGAIYVCGHVVEMILKAAFLRLAGHADDDPITMSTLRNYVGESGTSTARSLGLPGSRNLHDLSAWANLIVAYRADRGLVYPEPGFDAALLANVAVIHALWSETIRYHKNVAYVHELARVRISCQWVRDRRAAI